ncbi:MAG: TRAP transporter small permease [Limnohabitans sp.]|jgi:TRAP-type C4-dicarboxylate transport system permease small subunit
MKFLHPAAAAFAFLGGALLLFITVLTCVSVIGRNTIGWTVDGDFELVSFASGAALALCVPWCQLRRGNIIVDFFTAGASLSVQSFLDRIGALGFALFMAAGAWRGSIGGLNAWSAQSGSMMLGFPDWVVYALLVPGLSLAALIALHQTAFGFGTQESAL